MAPRAPPPERDHADDSCSARAGLVMYILGARLGLPGLVHGGGFRHPARRQARAAGADRPAARGFQRRQLPGGLEHLQGEPLLPQQRARQRARADRPQQGRGRVHRRGNRLARSERPQDQHDLSFRHRRRLAHDRADRHGLGHDRRLQHPGRERHHQSVARWRARSARCSSPPCRA